MSILSAAIVGGVLAATLTSSSFELERQANAGPVVAGGVDVALAPAPGPAPTDAQPRAPDRPAPRIIYYIVNSAEEMVELHLARRADLVYVAELGLPPMPQTAVYYELYETPEEAEAGLKLLHELAYMAPYYGFDFSIIDLRK